MESMLKKIAILIGIAAVAFLANQYFGFDKTCIGLLSIILWRVL